VADRHDSILDAIGHTPVVRSRKLAFVCAVKGTSTRLNVVGALRVARELGPGHVVATVAVDSGLKYLTGDLFQ
jgi:cysteine synthase